MTYFFLLITVWVGYLQICDRVEVQRREGPGHSSRCSTGKLPPSLLPKEIHANVSFLQIWPICVIICGAPHHLPLWTKADWRVFLLPALSTSVPALLLLIQDIKFSPEWRFHLYILLALSENYYWVLSTVSFFILFISSLICFGQIIYMSLGYIFILAFLLNRSLQAFFFFKCCLFVVVVWFPGGDGESADLRRHFHSGDFQPAYIEYLMFQYFIFLLQKKTYIGIWDNKEHVDRVCLRVTVFNWQFSLHHNTLQKIYRNFLWVN